MDPSPVFDPAALGLGKGKDNFSKGKGGVVTMDPSPVFNPATLGYAKGKDACSKGKGGKGTIDSSPVFDPEAKGPAKGKDALSPGGTDTCRKETGNLATETEAPAAFRYPGDPVSVEPSPIFNEAAFNPGRPDMRKGADDVSKNENVEGRSLPDPDAKVPDPAPYPGAIPGPGPKDGSWTGNWKVLVGDNAPAVRDPEPLPPVGPVFFYRCLRKVEARVKPDLEADVCSRKVAGEFVRVCDIRDLWLRLAPETEKHVEDNWEAWILSETDEELLLEEVTDPLENEKAHTKQLMDRLWRIHDDVKARIRDTSQRGDQFMSVGRVPPTNKDRLPSGTRTFNAFWGLEARLVSLGPDEEYWPQGAMHIHPKEQARNQHWRIFATRTFEQNELIEVCPLVEINIHLTMAALNLRDSVIETPKEDGPRGLLDVWIPLGYGMLYQRAVKLKDVKVNEEEVSTHNAEMVSAKAHMYVYATRRIHVDEEIVLNWHGEVRTDDGAAIDMTGFTPYWCRDQHPEVFQKALSVPAGPRPKRPLFGHIKFGWSKIQGRGVFADKSYSRGEIVEICPCLILDEAGADAGADFAMSFPAVKQECEDGRNLTKREQIDVFPCGYGGMYNHSPEPQNNIEEGEDESEEMIKRRTANLAWFYDETTQCVILVATESVSRNQELTIDYGEPYWESPSRHLEKAKMVYPGKAPEWVDLLDYMRKSKKGVKNAA